MWSFWEKSNQEDSQVEEAEVGHTGPFLPVQRVMGGNGPTGWGSTPDGHLRELPHTHTSCLS